MLEKIVSLVKDQVQDKIAGDSQIPEDKKAATVQTTTTSILEGLKDYITPENLSSITSMFGSGGSTSATSGLASGLQGNVVSALTSKVGLSQGVAQSIASTVIPAIMSMFSKKVNDDSDPGFNIGSLISSFTGGGNKTSSGGGIMDMVGNLFGKK